MDDAEEGGGLDSSPVSCVDSCCEERQGAAVDATERRSCSLKLGDGFSSTMIHVRSHGHEGVKGKPRGR
jgi:hypothetical protein